MEENQKKQLNRIIHLTQPLEFVIMPLVYGIGGGVAHILGHRIDWINFALGLLFISSMHLSYRLLSGYFDLQSLKPPPVKQDDPPGNNGKNILKSTLPLQGGLAFLTSAAVMIVLLYSRKAIHLPESLFVFLYVLLILALVLPPLRLEYSGYGELIHAVLVVVIGPSLGLLLQTGDLHRYLSMCIIPLVFLHIAFSLALSLKRYAEDISLRRKGLLLSMGWQRGVFIHNLFILSAFFLWGVASIAGFPWKIALPALLSLPLGAFQIWQVQEIASGSKPRWKLLVWGSYGLVIIPAYLINFALWNG